MKQTHQNKYLNRKGEIIMENLEKVEQLRERTGVSYEDAKNALDACNYDMLDALVYLEKLDKIKAPATGFYSALPNGSQSGEFTEAQENYNKSCNKESVGSACNKFFDWCRKLIRKGNETTFQVERHGKVKASIPVTILALLFLFCFWLTIPALIVGLFMDCKYSFLGFSSTTVDINDICSKASETCRNIKRDFQN